MARNMGREQESNSCLKKSSVLGNSKPNGVVLDSDLIVRDKEEKRPSFEGIVFCFAAEV